MDFQDCIKFANETPLSYFATIKASQPKVRPLALWCADDKGFHYQTQAAKVSYKQLKENNMVEACFSSPRVGRRLGTILRRRSHAYGTT